MDNIIQDTKALYVFGASTVLHSTKDNILSQHQSWANIIAENIDFELINYGEPSVDNNYIFRTFSNTFSNINPSDIVIIGWTHYSRFMFYKTMIDKNMANQSIIKQAHDKSSDGNWLRSKGPSKVYWEGGIPNLNQVFGNQYYDYFFKHYYDSTSFLLNTLEKMLLAMYMLHSNNIKYIFLTDRALDNNIDESNTALQMVIEQCDFCYFNDKGMIDFVEDNELMISKKDHHPNIIGHQKIASRILEYMEEKDYVS